MGGPSTLMGDVVRHQVAAYVCGLTVQQRKQGVEVLDRVAVERTPLQPERTSLIAVS